MVTPKVKCLPISKDVYVISKHKTFSSYITLNMHSLLLLKTTHNNGARAVGHCHVEDMAPVSKHNRQCTSRHVQIVIVEQAHKRPHTGPLSDFREKDP